jgi:dTDP-4-dehydrorhamnose reductase
MGITKYDKICITGASGMLADAFIKYYKKKGAAMLLLDIDSTEGSVINADVGDFARISKVISDYNPQIVMHLAARTDLEYCENNSQETWRTNALGTENVANICSALDIPMVYISTAGIFDGKKNEYNDYDDPNPLNVYGSSKYAGEKAVTQLLSRYFVFRAGWMMGGGPNKDKKFVSKILKQIKNGKSVLKVVDDKLGTPTYTHDFVRTIDKVILSNYYGVFNLVCEGLCSRYDVANEIIKTLGLDIKIEKVNSDYFHKEYFAIRPYSEQLIPLKLRELGFYNMRDWKTCLREYLKNEWITYLK